MKKLLLTLTVLSFISCSIENKTTSINEDNATKDSLLHAERMNKIEEEFKDFDEFKPLKQITITKEIKEVCLDSIVLKVNWNEKYEFNTNLERHVGGINKLKIYKGKELMQVIDSIRDEEALGEIPMSFADYNFDGYIDFTLPLGSCGKNCYYKYFLFNPTVKKYVHAIDWDKVKVQSTNRQKHHIRTIMEGTCCEGEFYILQPEGLKLLEVKKVNI